MTAHSIKGSKEKSTVIKKIVDKYLVKKLGYDLQNQLFFDESVKGMGNRVKGYTDIEIKLNGRNTDIIIEAKRSGKKLGKKEKNQAIQYGKLRDIILVALTNGSEYQLYNSYTGNQVKLNGLLMDDIPRCKDLPIFLTKMSKDVDDVSITINTLKIKLKTILKPCMDDIFDTDYEKSMVDLENVFKRCHDILRDREKFTPEESFEEFSKILFLKLYSKKLHDEKTNGIKLKANDINKFEEISNQKSPVTIKNLVENNFNKIIQAYRGEVFEKSDRFKIKKSMTFKELVDELSGDIDQVVDADVKGRAYEHFLAAVLKGSKLGQFFTPRPIVNMMVRLVNPLPADQILDPACGSGGFLIRAMQAVDWHIDNNPHERESAKQIQRDYLQKESLFGSDAGMVAKTAKMNMILAGDGHNNIKQENSLTEDVSFLQLDQKPLFDIILTNPPFGLKEKMTKEQLEKYDVPSSKAQSLFLQLMIRKVKPNCTICTVIDEGVLNTPTYRTLRKYIFKHCFVLAVFSLPETTFKPHYSGVKTSILFLRRKENELIKQDFPIFGYDLQSVGYSNTGKPIKENDISNALEEWNNHVRRMMTL